MCFARCQPSQTYLIYNAKLTSLVVVWACLDALMTRDVPRALDESKLMRAYQSLNSMGIKTITWPLYLKPLMR